MGCEAQSGASWGARRVVGRGGADFEDAIGVDAGDMVARSAGINDLAGVALVFLEVKGHMERAWVGCAK